MTDANEPNPRVVYTPWPVSRSEWVPLTPEPLAPQPAPLPSIADAPTDFLIRPEADDAAPVHDVDDEDPPLFAQLQARWLPAAEAHRDAPSRP